MRTKLSFVVITLLLVTGVTGSALASGFALIEQSAKLQGNAYAGAAAMAEDASIVFFNPAGMTKIAGTLVTAGLQVVMPQAKFENQGSTYALGGSLAGGNGGDAGKTGFVPALFFVHSLENGLSYGLGINVPFGLSTEYDNGWVGRYHALNSEVSTVNINPSIAYKVNDLFSFGVGVSAQRIDAKVSNAIDFGGLDAAGAFASAGLPAGALGLTPQGSDGTATLKGDDWSYGYNLGVTFNLTEATTIGLAYRSKIEHTIEGDATFTVPAAIAATLQPAGFFSNSSVAATVELPASASFSIFHQINEQWAVMADYTWTEWSSLPELRFEFGNNMSDGVTTLNWEDSSRYALGVTFTPNNKLTIRTGVAFDETPIPNDAARTPRIPGADRTWVSLGCGYVFTENLSIDAAYSHLFVDDPKIAKDTGAPTSENFFRGGLTGTYEASVDIVSAQVNYHF
jgi:long-chain fatty acid transport protein